MSVLMKSVMAAFSVAAISVTAVAAQPSPTPATGEQKVKQNRPRMECRSVVQSGTRLATRTCRPASDWEDEARAAQDSAWRQIQGPGEIPVRDGNAGTGGNSPKQ